MNEESIKILQAVVDRLEQGEDMGNIGLFETSSLCLDFNDVVEAVDRVLIQGKRMEIIDGYY